jgi:anti-sigma factor RsiW
MADIPDDFKLPDDDLACVDEVEIITDYLEGALPADDARRLEEHIAMCQGCTEYIAQMRELAGGLGELREESVPADLRDAVIAAFRNRSRS